MKDLLSVGDTVFVKTFMGKSKYPITRVTKTLAFSKRIDDGYEHAFKREISHDMSHPRQIWNTVEYSVIKNRTTEIGESK